MKGPARMVITGDVLRVNADGSPNQPINIRWLYHLLKCPLARALGASDVDLVVWDDLGAGIDARRIYSLCGLAATEENWARLTTAEELPPAAVESLRPYFDPSIVVGFELPDVLLRAFLRLGIDYVDLTIHPARFLDDIIFGIRTSIPEAFEALKRRGISEEIFHIHAGLHQATVSRMAPLLIPPDSCLCVGQTRVDKSLVSNGQILSLLDYLEDFKRIATRHTRTFFKPHPYAEGQEEILRALRKLADVEVTHDNVYRLLCDDQITEVFGISSSVVYEAGFFGKKATYLYRNPITLAGPEAVFDPWAYVPVGDDLLSPRFWADLLRTRCDVADCPEIRLAPKTSRLRVSLQSHWGYNFLDYELLMHNLAGERI